MIPSDLVVLGPLGLEPGTRGRGTSTGVEGVSRPDGLAVPEGFSLLIAEGLPRRLQNENVSGRKKE